MRIKDHPLYGHARDSVEVNFRSVVSVKPPCAAGWLLRNVVAYALEKGMACWSVSRQGFSFHTDELCAWLRQDIEITRHKPGLPPKEFFQLMDRRLQAMCRRQRARELRALPGYAKVIARVHGDFRRLWPHFRASLWVLMHPRPKDLPGRRAILARPWGRRVERDTVIVFKGEYVALHAVFDPEEIVISVTERQPLEPRVRRPALAKA